MITTRIPTLAIRTAHIRVLAMLPELHKDPFIYPGGAVPGRKLTLVSKDGALTRYGVPLIW